MCGIVGVVGQEPVANVIYEALTVLQHRGQEAAGIVTCEQGRLHLCKDNGLVKNVFDQARIEQLVGNMGIGHVRYPTAGSFSQAEAQPFYVNSPFGISLAHNGNLTNATELHSELFLEDRRHINTESDSEILLNVFAQELLKQNLTQVSPTTFFDAVTGLHQRCRGAYAVVAMVTGLGVIGFRDPHGIRPIVFGKRETPDGPEYMVASESVALDVLGFELIRDLAPGEAVCIDTQGQLHTRQCAAYPEYHSCIFEYVYFARPDSVIDRVFVHKARMRMGERLGQKILREWPDHDIDVVIPIPDTSRTAAQELALVLGVKEREGFIKNRYIGRTFIMPGQRQRRRSVRQKLNPIGLEFKNKNVLLVDDSIVRGTTSQQIVQMAREMGARNVYFASASPPIRYPNIYGIDMPAAEELIAYGRDNAQICQALGADHLIFQDLDDLIHSVQRGNKQLTAFDCSVFNGNYITDENADYFTWLESTRKDSAQDTGARLAPMENKHVLELHNNVDG